jgi:mercuric ion transport protein
LRKIAGFVLAGTALIACPCHLVLLLPVVLGLLGGTALGAALAANTGWVVAAATAYFALALAGALHLLYRRGGNAKGSGRTPPMGREARERRAKTGARTS